MNDHVIALRLGRRFVDMLFAGALALAMMATSAVLARAASDTTLSRTVDGVTIHLGVMSSKMVFERAGSHPEGVAHGTRRPGKASQHLVVAVFDAKSGSRIDDAKVKANVTELGLGNEEKTLEPMTIGGAPSYGNHFTLKPGGRYAIKVSVWRPGAYAPAVATFDYSRP